MEVTGALYRGFLSNVFLNRFDALIVCTRATPQTFPCPGEEVDGRQAVVSGVPFASIEEFAGRSMLEITNR